MQVGSIGLLKAIERCDVKRADDFAAFAVPTVAGEIKRHLRDRADLVRLPRGLREAAMRLPSAREELTARLGRQATPAELAAVLGVAEDQLQAIEDGATTADRGDAAASFELDDRILLADAFKELDETERAIVYLRFVREESRRETARRLGMTEDRLRRATRDALAKLRGGLEQGAFPVTAPEPPAEAVQPPPEPAPQAEESNRHSGRILVRMPPTLHDQLAQAAEREGVSLNQYMTNALAASVDRQRRGEPRAERPRWLPAAIVTNIVLLALTGVAAVVLLLVALSQGS